jgi:hypothetical protein
MPRAGARGASLKLGAWIETSVRRIVLHLPKSFIDRGAWCCIA